MTEAAPPKPFFTRRRVIVCTVALFVIVGVMGVGLGVFDAKSVKGLKMEFVRFDKSLDTQSTVAVVRLINASDDTIYVTQIPKRNELVCELVRRHTTIHGVTQSSDDVSSFVATAISGNSEHTQNVPLPTDAGVIQLYLTYSSPSKRPPILQKLLAFCGQLVGADNNPPCLVCEQLIQCPKLLPDGTVEPPRLVSAPGGKP